MTHRPVPPPALARWPFYLGDVILLSMAGFAILFAGTPPSMGMVALAMACALIGIGLLLVPYLREYEGKLKIAEQAARDASDAQAKRLTFIADQLNNVISRSQAAEEQAGQALGNLEDLSEKLASQVEDLTLMLSREGEAKETNPTGAVEKTPQARDREIDGLAAKLSSIEKALIELAKRTTPDAPRPVEELSAPVSEPAVEEARSTHGSPQAGETVARPKQETKASRKTPTQAPKRTAKEQKTRAVATPQEVTNAPEPQSELEFSPKPGSAHSASKTKSNGNGGATTALVATAYIGIGNKLFLRGEGPGLSWDKGVLMEFLAIGKWGWKTAEATAPVSCKIFRNDDTPMLDEEIIIDPGQRVEIAPRF